MPFGPFPLPCCESGSSAGCDAATGRGDAVKAISTRALPSQLVLNFLALQGNQGLSLQI